MLTKLRNFLSKRKLQEKQDYTFRLISRTDRSAQGKVMSELNTSEVDQLAHVHRTEDEAYAGTLCTKVKLKNGELERPEKVLDSSGRTRKLVNRDPAHTKYNPISYEVYHFEGDDRIVDSSGTYKDGQPVRNK